MARQSKMTAAKRARERALAERRHNKLARRTEDKSDRPKGSAGAEDPDIAGIVPGPQPPQWWQTDETEEEK
jgi:hypothetical protein